MAVTESQALAVVSGASMKMELRIPMEISDHDDLITAQIVAAVSYVVETTGRAVDDLAELRPAVVAIVRAQYDGYREVTEDSAHYAWMAPFRSYKAG